MGNTTDYPDHWNQQFDKHVDEYDSGLEPPTRGEAPPLPNPNKVLPPKLQAVVDELIALNAPLHDALRKR